MLLCRERGRLNPNIVLILQKKNGEWRTDGMGFDAYIQELNRVSVRHLLRVHLSKWTGARVSGTNLRSDNRGIPWGLGGAWS